jgi:hypothetical protein
MLSIDLFNSRFEKRLQEGAVDDLEARRIDDLNMRMLELLDRAKEPAYKKNPEALAGLKREFQRLKDERDSYYKIREAGIPGNVPTEKIPGKEDLLKGKGRTYYEGAEDYAGIYSPEAIALGKRFCEHYNITDDGDVQLAVEIIDNYLDQFKAAGEPVDLKKIRSGVADAFRQVYRGMGPGPNFRKRFQEAEQAPRAYGVANFQRLVKANMGNVPTVNFEFIRPEENFKLDQRGLDLISDYYDGLENDQAKNYFIYRVLPSGDETLKVLKQLGWNPAQPVQQELPGMPTQGELPLSEKKKSEVGPNFKAGDVKVARELQKLRAQYPAARSDVEAVARAEIDSTERSQQQLAAIRGANEKQDALLKQLVALDKEQGQEINNLDQENNTLEKELAKIQSTNDRLQQTIGQMTGTKKSAKTSKTAANTIDLIPGAPADARTVVKSQPEVEPQVEPKPARSPSSAIASVAQQIQGLNKAAPTIRPAPGLKAANEPVEPKVSGSDIAEHGGGIGPRQHWQDLMPEQSNTEDDDWYDDEEDQGTELRSGDYVRDTQDGEHGEVFRMQGDPYERRVRILDRDGRGWYIEPSRLTRVDPQDPDVQRYFGKKRVRDMDEASYTPTAGELARDLIKLADADFNKKYGMPKQQANRYYSSSKLKDPGMDEAQKTDNRPASQFDREIVKAQPDGSCELKCGHKTSAKLSKNPVGKKIFCARCYELRNKEQGVTEGDDHPYDRGLEDGLAGKEYNDSMYSSYEDKESYRRGRIVAKQQAKKGVAEGWSDAIVSRRTGRPRTPYSVYIKGKKWKDFENDDHARAVMDKLKAKFRADGRDPETVTIAPTDIAESLVESIKDAAGATAVIACLLTGGSLTGCATAPQQTSAQQVLKTGQDLGRTVQTAKRITRASTEAEVQQELRNILRGVGGRPEELNHSNILRIWRRVNEPKPQQNEAQEIVSKEDFVRERDRLLRMIGQETNPANKQILRSAIRQLENRAEQEGWLTIQQRIIREENASQAVEQAILKRIMVAHLDLLRQYGPQKVMQAAEEVAYNVGDVDEIGTSDVSAYVAQVKQILGATS